MCQKSAHSLAASTLHKAETAFVTLGENRLGVVQPFDTLILESKIAAIP